MIPAIENLVFRLKQICKTNVKIICVKLIISVQESSNKSVKKKRLIWSEEFREKLQKSFREKVALN